MRDGKAKIGDFGVSFFTQAQGLHKKEEMKFKLRGITETWCLPEISEKFDQYKKKGAKDQFFLEQWSHETLELNDIHGLGKSFNNMLISKLIN